MTLLSDVLPAATGEELLRKLREVARLRAVGVRRDPWPGYLTVDADGSRTVDAAPPDATAFDAGFVVGECDAAVIGPLLAQAAAMDAALEHAKLAAVAELAAGAGHEVNNPLATIAARADSLRRGEVDPDRRRSLDAILAQAFRARDMIGDLMLFARPPEPAVESVSVADAVAEVVADLLPRSGGVIVETAVPIELRVAADPTQLRVVLAELIRNAVGASPDGGRVDVVAENEGGCVRITVADDGAGFTAESRRHAFDPFYSGRQSGRGLGFGLSKCWRIVTAHGGAIRIADDEPRTTIEVWWPDRRV